ncbi:MAG TPA: sulfotransferase [Gammaproteobacteria bacterium]|nr:sulfotransferase [Gammaproteobacteria bacterium]
MPLTREFRHGRELLFVGGSPRTGTTLVQNILDSHPDIAGGPEFDNIPDIVGTRNKLVYSVKTGRITDYVSAADVDREFGYLIERLLLPYLSRNKVSLVSEKTPFNAFVFRELLDMLPACRCIFCVRDPRSVAASLLAVGARAAEKSAKSPAYTRNISDAIKLIQASYQAGFSVATHPRLLVLVYEELVREPERQTRKLCEFLGIPWHKEMVSPHEKKHDGDRYVDNIWYDMPMYYRPITSGGPRAPGKGLTSAQLAAVNEAFRDDANLAAIGYTFP